MKKGKYAKRTPFVKTLAVAMVLVTLIGCAIGGTLAWLTDETQQVVNTFTVGKVGVNLTETNRTYKMIPGWYMVKDPKASVTVDSEDCYLFVKVTESTNAKFSDYMTYEIAQGWQKVPKVNSDGNPEFVDGKAVYEDGVYYMVFKDSDAGAEGKPVKGEAYSVLEDDKVWVKKDVTETMMEALDGIDADGKDNTDAAKAEIDARPTLTFQAYAAQLYKTNGVEFTAGEAWAIVSGN